MSGNTPSFSIVLTAIAAAICCLILVGCTSHYQVTDPVSRGRYYTTRIDRHRSGGITFDDEKSGQEVTLQSSEIKKISSSDFEVEINAKGKGKEKDEDKDKNEK